MEDQAGLFLHPAGELAKGYPEITYGEHIVDNTCMQLVYYEHADFRPRYRFLY